LCYFFSPEIDQPSNLLVEQVEGLVGNFPITLYDDKNVLHALHVSAAVTVSGII